MRKVSCPICLDAVVAASSASGNYQQELERALFDHVWWKHQHWNRCWCGFDPATVRNEVSQHQTLREHVMRLGGVVSHYLAWQLGVDDGVLPV